MALMSKHANMVSALSPFSCALNVGLFLTFGWFLFPFQLSQHISATNLQLATQRPPITSTKLCAEWFLSVNSPWNKRHAACMWYQKADSGGKKRCRVDSVQQKCRLSDLPLMRRHLRQEGRRKLLLWKTHRWACHGKKKQWKWIKKNASCFLRADKETLKGIK